MKLQEGSVLKHYEPDISHLINTFEKLYIVVESHFAPYPSAAKEIIEKIEATRKGEANVGYLHPFYRNIIKKILAKESMTKKIIPNMKDDVKNDKVNEEQIRKEAQAKYPIPRRWSSMEALETLGLPANTSDPKIIKKAYYSLAQEFHPDKFEKKLTLREKIENEERMKQINSAYSYLSSSPLNQRAENQSSSAINQELFPSTAPRNLGGIDFRVIHIVTQPLGGFSNLNLTLPAIANLDQINLDEELRQIQNMLKAGIIPSGIRLKELAAACYQKGKLSQKMDSLVACLLETLKLEEEILKDTSPELKETLIILDQEQFAER